MKLRSAPLDDVHGEVVLVLDDDDRRSSRIVRWLVNRAYGVHHRLLLGVLRLPWRKLAGGGCAMSAGSAVDLADARRYLHGLEMVARLGQLSTDPRETVAALKMLAQPSNVLKRLARVPGGFPAPGSEPFNLSDDELGREWGRP